MKRKSIRRLATRKTPRPTANARGPKNVPMRPERIQKILRFLQRQVMFTGKSLEDVICNVLTEPELIRLLRAGASVLEKRRDSGHRPEIPSGLLKPEPKEEAEEEEEEEDDTESVDSPLISDEDELQEDDSDEALGRIDDEELKNHSGHGAPNQDNKDGDDTTSKDEEDGDALVAGPRPSTSTTLRCISDKDRTVKQERKSCPYGNICYRKNPQHKLEEAHPGDHDYESEGDGVDEDADEDGADDIPECEYGTDCYRENRQHLRDFKHTKKPEAKRREEVSDSYDLDDDTDDDDDNNDDDYEPEEVESEEEGVEIVVEAKRSPAPGKKGAVRPTRPSPDVPQSDFFCQICNRGCGLQLHKFIQSPP